MTTPTPAQIEAAQKVLRDYLGPVQSGVAAIRAITAAAEVGTHNPSAEFLGGVAEGTFAEREACAQVADNCETAGVFSRKEIAAAIRARKDKP